MTYVLSKLQIWLPFFLLLGAWNKAMTQEAIALDSMDVFYVYSTTCGPCMATFPKLGAFHDSFQSYPIRWNLVCTDRDSKRCAQLAASYRNNGWTHHWTPQLSEIQKDLPQYKNIVPYIAAKSKDLQFVYKGHDMEALRTALNRYFK